MTFFRKKDIKNRNLFQKNELTLLFYKIIFKLKAADRFFKKNYLNGCRSVITRINNSCIITGRVKATYRKFRVSRMVIKGMSSFGYLPGIKRSC